MSVKSVLTGVLLAFVGVSVVVLIARESGMGGGDGVAASSTVVSTAQDPGDTASIAEGHVVRVYYLHTAKRCMTCLTIEAFAKEALESRFAEELEQGMLVWDTASYELAGNTHYVEDFELVTSTLVVVDTINGERRDWRKLDRVWELVDDETAFKDYVAQEVGGYLEADS